jgi:hypothetical protein
MVKSASISDTQFRIAVGAAGLVLIVGIAAARFCGSVSLPAKPPPPVTLGGASRDLDAKASASPAAYQGFLARDAAAAGLRVPTLDEMARKLPYRVDEVRHVLEVGEPPLELAGLQLRTLHRGDALVLEIGNATGSDLAYDVASSPIAGASCNTAATLPFNAMTIARDHAETRVECAWRDGISLAVTRVETLEVPPLAVWYLSHVPPSVVGIEPRIARGHQAETSDRCGFVVPQSVRSGLERGEIGWRDLTDFYSRHRCQSYRFPLGYRAFRADGERRLPAASAGM